MTLINAATAVLFVALSAHAANSENADATVACGAPVTNLRLCISLVTTVFSPTEPIILSMVLTNEGQTLQRIPQARLGRVYKFHITRDGEEIPLTSYGAHAWREVDPALTRETHYGIAGGGKYREKILLNRFFDLSMPGDYTVTASRSVTLAGYGEPMYAASGEITFTIRDRIPELQGVWGGK